MVRHVQSKARMRSSSFLLASALGVASATTFCLLLAACTSAEDDTTTVTSATEPDGGTRVSQKGEVCQASSDCADGLACAPVPGGIGGICSVATFGIAPTAKECVGIECREAIDCCPQAPATCPQILALCQDGGASSAGMCQQYDLYCKCDAAKYDCAADRCVTKCTADTECALAGPGFRCFAGKCAGCAVDTDCGGNSLCLDGTCKPMCRSDSECMGFARCTAGKCVDSGCKSDRECVAATRNVESKCGTDGKCTVACESDIECGNPRGYTFVSCIDKRCTYTGCESDKDCRLFGSAGTSGGPADMSKPIARQLVCRESKR